MADEEISPEEKADLRKSADLIVVKVIVKQLLVEIASKERSPEQAADYVENFKNTISSLLKRFGDPENKIETYVIEQMNETLEGMFAGIKFVRAK